jgi:hypothetical protein
MKAILRSGMIPALQVLLLMAVAPLAAAYIGPGSGISVIGSLLGLLATILITVGAIALFPFRKMMKKRKALAAEGAEDEFSQETEDSALESVRSEGASTK